MGSHVEASGLDNEHPFALEISSLKSAVSRFQDEAYNSSVKLQHFSYDTSALNDRLVQLERENEVLKHEIATLRASPHPDSSPQSHPAVLQSQQLTLSLRRLSDKLTLTEETLLERTTELVHARNETAKLVAMLEAASMLAEQGRDIEEQRNIRERDLERKIWELKEEAKMSDLVVNEYADLVRSLEGRASTHKVYPESNGSLAESLSEGRLELHKLFAEFSEETEKLEAEIHRLRGVLAESQTQCDVEKQVSEADRVLLAKCQHELDRLKNEDKSAAQMVSRYMKFSQSSTNLLQESLSTLKIRHAATIDTLSAQLSALSTQLHVSQATSEKLRSTLDELGKDILRESFGRRREIALRLRLVSREEIMFEGLGRWVRRAQEALDRDQDSQQHALETMLADARVLLAVLDGPESGIGSSARIIAAETTVKALNIELQKQTSQRIILEKLVALKGLADMSVQESSKQVEGQQFGDSSSATSVAHDVPIHSHHVEKEQPSLPIETPTQQTFEQSSASVSRSDEIGLPSGSKPVTNTDNSTDLPSILPEANRDVDHTVPDNSDESFLTPTRSNSVIEQLPNDPSPVVFPSVELIDKEGQHPTDSLPPEIPPESLPHPLLDELTKVSHRYDDIQRAFRDCHLALQDLKHSILSGSSPSENDLSSSYSINGFPAQLFQTAVERLDDFTEDARVELEIQIADEALRVQGFETLLSIPDVFSKSISIVSPSDSVPTLSEIELQIQAFVSGTDAGVQKAQQSSSRKLVDVQNDIAILKRVLHDPDVSLNSLPTNTSPTTPTGLGNSGGSWTSWIRSSPRPVSPVPAPTFGNVMTSPRLRHTSSFHSGMSHGRKVSNSEDLSIANGDMFADLGLRVAMPILRPSTSTPGAMQRGPRARTVSTMYTLGLGSSRSSSSVFSSSGPSNAASSQQAQKPSATPLTTSESQDGEEDEQNDEVASDIE